jgi:hypothetical protein
MPPFGNKLGGEALAPKTGEICNKLFVALIIADSDLHDDPSRRCPMFRNPARLTCMLAACILAGAVIAPQARADDASCKPVLGALMKQARTPYHEMATADGRSFEKIYTTTTLYIGNGGHWMKVPATPEGLIDAMRENGQTFSSCKSLRTEMVDGQAATVYAAHSQTTTPPASNDAQIWIADASGLPVKTEADEQGGGRKGHVSTQLIYGNVQAPAGAK